MKSIVPIIFILISIHYSCKAGKSTTKEPDRKANEMGVVSIPLTGTTWWLTELEGKPVPAGDKRPFLEIYDDSTFAAEDGCSRITGTVSIREGNRISFNNFVSSMNACPGQTLEAAFRRALEQCDNYSIQGSALGLQKGKMAPFARFIAVTEEE